MVVVVEAVVVVAVAALVVVAVVAAMVVVVVVANIRANQQRTSRRKISRPRAALAWSKKSIPTNRHWY